MEKMRREGTEKSLTLGAGVSESLFRAVEGASPAPESHRRTKISVVGVGNVGMAIAQTMLTQDLADELALVDTNPEKLRGEMLDLQHAAAFLPRTAIRASVDYSVTAASDLCIVTAGARQIAGESRLELLERNVAVFRSVIPPLARLSPEAVLVIVSNPVDVLSYVAWKLSGFPPNRVVGSGTNLDSSRFRFLMADHLQVNAQDVEAMIVGEHGESSVALWSSISVGGVPMGSFLEKKEIAVEKQALDEIHRRVVDGAGEVIRLKGYTSWAIGYSVANIARSILRDQRRIHPVSVLARDGVFLSLPALLGRHGVISIVNVPLSPDESSKFDHSARTIRTLNAQLHL